MQPTHLTLGAHLRNGPLTVAKPLSDAMLSAVHSLDNCSHETKDSVDLDIDHGTDYPARAAIDLPVGACELYFARVPQVFASRQILCHDWDLQHGGGEQRMTESCSMAGGGRG